MSTRIGQLIRETPEVQWQEVVLSRDCCHWWILYVTFVTPHYLMQGEDSVNASHYRRVAPMHIQEGSKLFLLVPLRTDYILVGGLGAQLQHLLILQAYDHL